MKQSWFWATFLFVSNVFAVVPGASAQRVGLPMTGGGGTNSNSGAFGGAVSAVVELGPVPGSQMLTLTVLLKPSADRVAALEQAITDQQTPGPASYRQWLSPAEFAASFGVTDDQIVAVSTWLGSQGLAVEALSAGKTWLTVTGSAARVQAAFQVELRRYSSGGAVYFARAASQSASVPAEIAGSVAAVSGLSDRPAAAMLVKAIGADGTALSTTTSTDALGTIEAAIDADATAILTVSSTACSADFGQADYDAWRAALRQAEAQGITVLATSECKAASGNAGSFPATLAEVTAVATLPAEPEGLHRARQERDEWGTGPTGAEGFVGIAPRPGWQFADGLPLDGFREEPDATADIAMMARTLAAISRQIGTRLGNVAPMLYEMAKTPGLYTQPDAAAPGTWERATGLGVVDLSVLAEAFPRGKIGTSSLLAASNYAPYHGKSLTLTATVTSTGGTGIPTGTVTFTSTQHGTLGTGTLNAQGVATFTSDSLVGGTYTLTSVYSGDGTYTGSTSGVATVTVVGELSLITPTVAAGAVVGGSATVHISVTSASGVGTPSGTVTVAPQGTVDSSTATATLSGTNGTAKATVLLPVYQAGTFTLLVSCNDPDPSFTCYSPVSAQMTVAKGASETTITSSPASPATGEPYKLTATVSTAAAKASARTEGGTASVAARSLEMRPRAYAAASGAVTATGTVSFMDGTTELGTAALASGMATYNGTAATATHHFVAAYSGDQNYGASSSAATTTTTGLATDTSLTASSYAIGVGQAITFYTTVYSTGHASTMTGTVTYSGAVQGVLGTGKVSGGLATLTLSSLPAGTYNMTATYSGDATFAGSSSTSKVIVTVGPVSVTLAGAIAPVPLTYGSNAVLTATASFAAGVVGGPAGTLQALVSGVTGDMFTEPLTPSKVGPSSTAKFTFGAPVPGNYSVILNCTASDTFPCAGPVTVPMTVLPGVTSTTLSLSPTTPLAGAATTLTAAIKNLGNNASASSFTGTVQFLVNNKLVGTAAVSGSKATLAVALPSGSAESLVAVYSGDTKWTSSTSNTITVSVAALLTGTALSSNVRQVISGVQVELTATVTGTAKGVVALTAPSGLVDFYDTYNGVLSKLGSATLASLGAPTAEAIFSATNLAAGTHVIYAIYEGDAIYKMSTSGKITLGSTNFKVSFVPATMTVDQGQTGTATLLVDFQGGFSGSVAFGCTPPPNVEITCSFNPAVITTAGTTTLTVTTVAPNARSGLRAAMSKFAGGTFAESTVMALLLIGIKPKRQPVKMGLLLVLLAIGTWGATGCAGTNLPGSKSDPTGPTSPVTTPTDPGSSLGTQVLAVTTAGSDGTNTVRHDYSYQVTVQ